MLGNHTNTGVPELHIGEQHLGLMMVSTQADTLTHRQSGEGKALGKASRIWPQGFNYAELHRSSHCPKKHHFNRFNI